MADCGHTPGNAAMYGLGIRVGFYLQWFSMVVAPWLAASEVHGLQLVNTLFVLASSLALVIQTSKSEPSPAEVYIILLLVFGSFYLAVPIYLWRLVTCCSPNYDPSRWPRAPLGAPLRIARFLLFISLLGFQLWFWASGRKDLKRGCQQYGFLFAKIPIESGGFVAWNIVFNLALLLGGLWALFVAAGLIRGHRGRRKKRVRRTHVEALQQLQSAFELTTASLTTMAVELVIQWNKLDGVSDISTAAQLIPTIVSAGLLACVFSAWAAQPDGGSLPSSKMSANSRSASRSHPRSGGSSGAEAGPPLQPDAGFTPARKHTGPSRNGGSSSHEASEGPTSTTSSSPSEGPQNPFPFIPPAPAPPTAGPPRGPGGVPPPFPPANPAPVLMSASMPPAGGAPPPLQPISGLPPPQFR